jgi:hypothetical protein
MSISVEAAEARDSLSDDKEIVNSYEVTIVLDFVCVCVCLCVFGFYDYREQNSKITMYS